MKIRYLLTATVLLSIVSLFIGVVDIKPSDLLDFQSEEARLFLISRVPRLVAILLAGAGMSIAGLIMQSLSRNKFVSPTTAGTLDATKLGVLIFAYIYANRFTVAGMGEDFAKNLGLSYKFVVNFGLVLVALISTTVVLTVGVIPFLGLIIPNIISLFKGDNLAKTLPHTALLGMSFLLLCDILGRVLIYPYEIPISMTVGVIGSAIFLFMLFRGRAYA